MALRLGLVRDLVGEEFPIAIDANQRWEVSEAIDWVNGLAQFDPYWIEEPTSTDDILGHAEIRRGVSPMKVATDEAVPNRIVFKQLLQAGAIDVLQLDATRVAGINENLAIILLAAQFDVPVCPHAGGVGLCEVVQHFAFFDFASVSGSQDGRMIEYVDHLHEHFVEPAHISEGRYVAPRLAGIGAEMLPESLERWTFPSGSGWKEVQSRDPQSTYRFALRKRTGATVVRERIPLPYHQDSRHGAKVLAGQRWVLASDRRTRSMPG